MKYIVIISLIFTAAVGVVLSQSGIQEEYLPQTSTIRELQNQLSTLENTLQVISIDEGLNQVSEIRKECRFLIDQPGEQTLVQINDMLHHTNLLEMALLFYANEKKQAENLALKIMTSNPSTGLSGKIANAELAMWFEELREQSIGLISITSHPSGGQVIVDQIPFGITPLENVFIPLGVHDIRIQRDGYTTWASQTTVDKKTARIVHAELRLNTGRLLVWAYPIGTQIRIDGSTIVNGTQALSPYIKPLARFLGLPADVMSQPVYLDAIKPGQHTIEFDADCHQRAEYKMDIGIGEYTVPLVKLRKTEAHVSLFTETPGQRVIIDTFEAGRTPIHNMTICPGSHEIKVEFPNQQTWRKTISVKDGDSVSFTCSPRPSILFLGCASPDLAMALEGAMPIQRWFEKFETFSVVDTSIATRYRYRPVVATVMEKAALGTINPDNLQWQSILNNMSTALLDSGASIFAFARLEPGNSKPSQLILLHKGSGKPDILQLDPGIPSETVPDVLSYYLNHPLDFVRLRTGLRFTCLEDQVIITEIIPGGPAEMSPFQTNDIITDMNGVPITQRNEIETLLRDPLQDTKITITCQRGNRELIKTWDIPRQATTIPLNDPAILYSLLLARLEMVCQHPEARPDHLLNAGICSLAIGQYSEAMEYFDRCQIDSEAGINNGTISFLKHLVEKKRGNKLEAQRNLEAARQSQNSTLIHGDGPLLSDIIQ